jgi:hypothetical protein
MLDESGEMIDNPQGGSQFVALRGHWRDRTPDK